MHSPRTCYLFLTLLSPFLLRAQANKATSEILTRAAAGAIFTDSVKKAFKIDFPIWRVYKYQDQSGMYYCVLTQSLDSIGKDYEGNDDTLRHAIRAVDLKIDGGKLTKVWELNDFLLKPEEMSDRETSIWFWTKYVEFRDLDDDGLIEPIIVYGTSTTDPDAGRVKILVYYKGQKIALRHQDFSLDQGRGTQIDKAYYSLPQKVKDGIVAKMKLMDKNGVTIFDDIPKH
jgi:hypothetical protein